MLGHVGIGAGEQDAQTRLGGLRGPHLLSGHHPLVAGRVELRLRAEVGQVRTRLGLAEELAPHLVASQHRRKEPGLLLRGAVSHQRGADHAVRDREHAGADAVARLLLVEDGRLDGAATPATEGLGPRDPGPTALPKGPLPALAVRRVDRVGDAVVLVAVREVVRVALGDGMALEPGASLGTKGLLNRCVLEVHASQE